MTAERIRELIAVLRADHNPCLIGSGEKCVDLELVDALEALLPIVVDLAKCDEDGMRWDALSCIERAREALR